MLDLLFWLTVKRMHERSKNWRGFKNPAQVHIRMAQVWWRHNFGCDYDYIEARRNIEYEERWHA